MKKGITPVIAIILLLLMAVAAAGALYLWYSRSQEDVASSAQTGMEKQVEQSSYRMSIESVWKVDDQLCLSVRNVGIDDYSASDVNNTAIYVNGTLVDWDQSSASALAQESSQTLCVCDGTASGSCTTSSASFAYTQSSDGTWPTVPVRVSPAKGTGQSRNYQYEE